MGVGFPAGDRRFQALVKACLSDCKVANLTEANLHLSSWLPPASANPATVAEKDRLGDPRSVLCSILRAFSLLPRLGEIDFVRPFFVVPASFAGRIWGGNISAEARFAVAAEVNMHECRWSVCRFSLGS